MPRVVLDGKLQGVVGKLHRHLGESQMAERNGGAECQLNYEGHGLGTLGTLKKFQKLKPLLAAALLVLFVLDRRSWWP